MSSSVSANNSSKPANTYITIAKGDITSACGSFVTDSGNSKLAITLFKFYTAYLLVLGASGTKYWFDIGFYI